MPKIKLVLEHEINLCDGKHRTKQVFQKKKKKIKVQTR